jgi:hypothetical protein
MKKQNFSTLVRKSIFLGFTSLLLFGSISIASAQSNLPEPTIKYVGTLDGQPVFRVYLDNQDKSVYHLTIKDDSGDILYAEKIKGKEFSKKFKFENADRHNVKLTFTLEGKEGASSQEFQVNNNIKIWNDVVVTSL